MSITKEEIDDLDDLDDLLDDFDDEAKPAPASDPTLDDDRPTSATVVARGASSGSSTTVDNGGGDPGSARDLDNDKPAGVAPLPPLDNDAFAKQLQAGMEDLMQELNASPEARRDFEQLMQQMQSATIDPSLPSGAAAVAAGPGSSSSSKGGKPTSSYPNSDTRKAAAATNAGAAGARPKNFQEQLNANIARMRETEQQAQRERDDNAGLTEAETDLFMREMMRQFESASGAGGANGENGGGDFSKVLEGMMAQLMSKEILYEPLLELDQKYPAWLRENAGHKDIKKYTDQAAIVREIVAKFEDEGYSDDDEIRKAEVMDLMGQMQDLGSPPQEIMGEDLGMLDGQMPKLGDGDCSIM